MSSINLLYIDLFCGAGGTSTGVESARIDGKQCAKVIACVNHDANAIASHAANHPDALHFTEDIRTLELSPLIVRLNIRVQRSFFGRAWNVRTSPKQKVGNLGTLIVAHLLNIFSGTLKLFARITFRLKTLKNL